MTPKRTSSVWRNKILIRLDTILGYVYEYSNKTRQIYSVCKRCNPSRGHTTLKTTFSTKRGFWETKKKNKKQKKQKTKTKKKTL